jgi:hypothetical protein
MRSVALALFVVASICSIAAAVPVNPVAANGIAAVSSESGPELTYYPIMILCTTGDIFQLHSNNSWVHMSGFPTSLPVPVSDVADWGPRHVRLNNGDYYVYTYAQIWQLVGGGVVAVPCTPLTPDEKTSLGKVKTRYR